jgi:hypothetical protein
MESIMFDTSQNDTIFFNDDSLDISLPNPDTLKQYCLDPAALWVLKRRASLPYCPPQRLPAVARGG